MKVTSDGDDVEFCFMIGEVKAKSGWGGAQGSGMGRASVEATLRKRTAALRGNVALVKDISTTFGTSGSADAYQCSPEALQKQLVRAVEDARKAAATVTCTAGPDCEVRWSRVTTWPAGAREVEVPECDGHADHDRGPTGDREPGV